MNQVKPYWKLGTLLFISILLIFSCNRQTKIVNTEDPLKFLFVPGVSDPFYYTMERGARSMAASLGIELVVTSYPEFWGPEYQIPILEKAAAAEHYDLILIAPTAKDALIEPLYRLYQQGTEIITVDTKIGSGDYSVSGDVHFPLSHIGTDNFLGGLKIAEKLAELMSEKGKVYINTTTQETSTTEERKNGFLEGISKFPDMEVVGIDYNRDIQSRAMEQTLTILQQEPDIVGIFATNVFSSQGASLAVSNAGLSGVVKLAAWDASETLINALINGEVDLVLGQKPAEMGSLAVEWGFKYFREKAQVPIKVIPGFQFFTQTNVNDPSMAEFIYSRQAP